MSNKERICGKILANEFTEMKLEYYLLSNDDWYGIGILKEDDENVEYEFVENISKDKKKTLDYLDTLSRNTVTPMSLRDITEDKSIFK